MDTAQASHRDDRDSWLYDCLPDVATMNSVGLPVWQNPSQKEFSEALRTTSGLRGLLTESDLYVWHNMNLLHPHFEAATGIDGIRIVLRVDQIQINHELVAFPELFPWVFPDSGQAEAMDMEDRRKVATTYLEANLRLGRVYSAGFTTMWYL